MSAANDAFERLGIAPTRDLKTIKRAYAVALKAIDQAHEREAFERLRAAYEQALAAAARSVDADDHEHDDDGGDEGDEDEEADEGENDRHGRDGFDGMANGIPAAPPFADPRRMQAPAPPAAPPVESPAMAPIVTPGADESRQALQRWTAQLRDAAPSAVAALFDAALADLRLLHLDSHAQLESRIAALLHQDPAGRSVLFDIAAQRFRWTERNARPIADSATAQWISRVVDQGLQWHSQPRAAIALQQQALDTAARVASPDAEQVRRFADVLADMASDHPDWFALNLDTQGHAHLAAWQAVHARLAPRWARQAERRQRYFGTRGQTVRTLVGGLFVLLIVMGVVSGLMNHLLGGRTPPASAAAGSAGKAGASAPPAITEPVLAYEFTGAITRDSCESAEEFVHESNWLQVDDNDAVALLATRAMRCQDKNLWSRKDDALMTCLRAERAAALGAGRPEDARHCAAPAPSAASR